MAACMALPAPLSSLFCPSILHLHFLAQPASKHVSIPVWHCDCQKTVPVVGTVCWHFSSRITVCAAWLTKYKPDTSPLMTVIVTSKTVGVQAIETDMCGVTLAIVMELCRLGSFYKLIEQARRVAHLPLEVRTGARCPSTPEMAKTKVTPLSLSFVPYSPLDWLISLAKAKVTQLSIGVFANSQFLWPRPRQHCFSSVSFSVIPLFLYLLGVEQ